MTTEHIVTSYEDELDSLDKKIALMGGLTEKLVGQATDALRQTERAFVVLRSV